MIHCDMNQSHRFSFSLINNKSITLYTFFKRQRTLAIQQQFQCCSEGIGDSPNAVVLQYTTVDTEKWFGWHVGPGDKDLIFSTISRLFLTFGLDQLRDHNEDRPKIETQWVKEMWMCPLRSPNIVEMHYTQLNLESLKLKAIIYSNKNNINTKRKKTHISTC